MKKNERLIITSFTIKPSELKKYQFVAISQGMSFSEFVREALKEYQKKLDIESK